MQCRFFRCFTRFHQLSRRMAATEASPFISRVNPTTGKLEWVVEDENYDYVQEIARSAYTDMLHDHERNQKYLAGIKKAIKHIHARGQQADVLDIGTGTGLLAMMAAQNGADTVHACEAFEPIGKAAEKIISKNGFGDKIKVIMKRSAKVTVGPGGDLPKRANILPAEVFDTELIGEGAIPTYLHAHKHLLTEDCICVPHSATVYAQVVQSDHLHNFHKLQPIRVTATDDIIPHNRMVACAGAASVYDLQLSQVSPDLFQPITDPLNMLDFNFSKGDFTQNRTHTVTVNAAQSGQCQCVFMWWELQMDTEGEVLLSTAPTWAHPDGPNAPWRDHWMQAIYYLPEPVKVQAGQSIDVTISHDDYSLWFMVASQGPVERPICQCGAHAVWSRPRFAMLNDTHRNNKFMSSLKKAVTPSSTCLSVSDGSLLPLIAAKLGASHVYGIEPNSLSRRVMEDIITANHLESQVTLVPVSAQDLKPSSLKPKVYSIEPNSLSRRVMEDIITANHLESLVTLLSVSAQDLKPSSLKSKIDVLMAEPFFISGLLPWHSLYFWYCRTSLADYLNDDVVILPRGGSLRAIAVEFEHLWKFHAPVGDLEGFDVRIFDDLVQKASQDTDASEEPHHLWEYPGRPLTSDFELMAFNFTKCVPDSPIDVTGEIPFFSSGACHGVALWMDFNIDDETTITTGLETSINSEGGRLHWCQTWKQGVHFMKMNPKIEDNQNYKLVYRASFKPNTGNIFFDFKVVGG